MKVWYTTEMCGHYPVGVCLLAVAETKRRARTLILKAAKAEGMPGGSEPLSLKDVHEVPQGEETAFVLLDGNY